MLLNMDTLNDGGGHLQWFRFPFPAMMRIHMILFTTMEFSILKYCEICDIRAETTVIWTLI